MIKPYKSPKMLTPTEVAKILKVSYDTALNFIKYSGVAYTKIGRQYRVNEKALEAIISSDDAIIVTFKDAC